MTENVSKEEKFQHDAFINHEKFEKQYESISEYDQNMAAFSERTAASHADTSKHSTRRF